MSRISQGMPSFIAYSYSRLSMSVVGVASSQVSSVNVFSKSCYDLCLSGKRQPRLPWQHRVTPVPVVARGVACALALLALVAHTVGQEGCRRWQRGGATGSRRDDTGSHIQLVLGIADPALPPRQLGGSCDERHCCLSILNSVNALHSIHTEGLL